MSEVSPSPDPSEESQTEEPATKKRQPRPREEWPVLHIQLNPERFADGYELAEKQPLEGLSNKKTGGVTVCLEVVDPQHGTVTVKREDREEYWKFPIDQVQSITSTAFEFHMQNNRERRSRTTVVAVCTFVSAAVLATFLGLRTKLSDDGDNSSAAKPTDQTSYVASESR